MAKNFLVLVIFFSSSFFLSLDVNGDEIYSDAVNTTSTTMSKKSKRAIGIGSEENRESNELPYRDDLGSLQSFAKRAPSGFTGMRGKKQFEYTDLSPNGIDWSFDDDYNILNEIRNKKAPSGFNGVRGKKMDQLEYEKSLLDQLFRRLYQENDDFDDMSVYRSIVPIYLHGYSGSDGWENSIEKRAPSGFTGMRGKRPLDFPFDGGKRAPNAFFGVRGKRDFKRSTAEQFKSKYFAMRGKKQPEFLGFRNKFVGVRGKKDSNAAKLQMLGIPVNSYRSMPRFLIDSPEFMSFKRAPAGFLGMRGKRQVSRDTLDKTL